LRFGSSADLLSYRLEAAAQRIRIRPCLDRVRKVLKK
jgi:hypothetical protein